MNILLTNDDGYDSLGIKTLKELLSKYGTVVIVAPDSQRSANSASLSIGHPLTIDKVEDCVFKCNGTPVDCVSMGLCLLNISFDLVVSGCNNGYNISYDTMYSGTVGAALESLIFRIPSIAVSAPHGSDFEVVRKYFDQVWKFIFDNELTSTEYLLNVNFPKGEVKGMEIGSLYYRKDRNYFEKVEGGYLAYRYLDTDFESAKDSDCYLYQNGIISIVPLRKTYFDKELQKELLKKIK